MTTLESASGDQDLWHVEVAPDDVRAVTLDQLDEAFNAGLINESTRVWQEGMACAVSLAELLGGDEEEAPQEVEPYAAYVPPQSPPPASHAPESSWPPVVAYSDAEPVQASYPPPSLPSYTAHAASAYPPAVASYSPPAASYPPAAASYPPPAVSSYPPPASYAPAPPSMAPMALDVPDFDIQYPRSGGKGKVVVGFLVVAAAAGAAVFQMNGGLAGLNSSTPNVAAAAVLAPPPPPQPVSHAYDPGPPVKLGESKPPLTITTRDEPKADDKKVDDKKVDDKKVDAKKTLASGKKPAPAVHSRHAAPAPKPRASNFKLGKSGSKYDPLNGSL